MTAAMLHLVGHAAFKSLGFLAAGSVLAATGLRDLDRLGWPAGCRRRRSCSGWPRCASAGFLLGAGFVSEWLLIRSLITPGPTTTRWWR